MNGQWKELLGSITGGKDSEEEDTNLYKGFDSNRNGKMVPSFIVRRADGNAAHGFFYQTIGNPMFQIRDDEEFISFTSSGTAVVLSGTRLWEVFEALMRGTLKTVLEYDGKPVKEGAPVVTALVVRLCEAAG